MINKKNSCIFLLTLLVLHLPALLWAEKHIDLAGGIFTVNKGASVQIGKSSSITIAKLITEADITGKGKLILLSDNNAFIDANNHSIENLVVSVANKVELLSGLQITNKLSILSGKLYLNDFNLILDPNTKLAQSTLEKIIQNGSGTIVHQSIGIPFAALPFTLSGPLHYDFTTCPFANKANRHKAADIIFYYQLPYFPEGTSAIPVPPPKAA